MIKLLAHIFIKGCENYGEPRVRTAYGILVGVVGIVLNFLLFAGKLIAGLICSSVSVIADAFNNLSDAGSSVITIAGYKIAAMPADMEHPFGHGRAEYVAGLIVSGAIIFMAFEIGKESLGKIISPEELNADVLSLCILGDSVLVKLYIFAYNRRVGKLINSAPMKAAAVDSLSDCISTLSAAAALAVSMLTGVNIDGWIGLFISFIIIKAGVSAAKDSLAPLLGQKADDSYIEDIKKDVMEFEGILGLHDLEVHNYGVNRNIVSFHAEVPADMTFMQAHDLVDHVENVLAGKYSAQVTIHMDPVVEDDESTAKCREYVLGLLSEIGEDVTMHDFRITERCGKRTAVFDVEVPFGLKMSDDEVRKRVDEGLKRFDPELGAAICIDKKIYR